MGEQVYKFHFAPLQGYSDHIFRNAFEKYFGGIDVYYTPFIRIEKGDFRKRDLRDIGPEFNHGLELVPQILPSTHDEFCRLAEMLCDRGYCRVDVNLGCPFPLVAGKKKGAGMLPYPELVEEILCAMKEFSDIQFSLKMRLGWEDVKESLLLVDMINCFPLEHITLHARTGRQQYKGSVQLDAFAAFYELVKYPLFYNGDILTIEDIKRILGMFPALKGIAIGRGLLADPWLVAAYKQLNIGDEKKHKEVLALFHYELFSAYAAVLQGDVQLLSKMKSFWEYFLPTTDRKLLKMIKKSNRISQYNEAVKLIFGR